MVFGFHGLEVNQKYDQEPHRKKDGCGKNYGGRPHVKKDAGLPASMKTSLQWARHEARSMGLSLEEYFKLPKDQRNY